MNWEQKMEAIKSLAGMDTCIKMRRPGDWYVLDRVDIKDGRFIRGGTGNGRTPEEAVNDRWFQLTELSRDQYLVVHAFGDDRKAVRWNGFMWTTVTEKDGQ